MDSAWRLPTGSGRIALIGSLVSRLVAFCLLYFAPVLAYEQGAPDSAPASAAVVGSAFSEPLGAESLDPKHEKDHDQDREADRGRAHLQRL
jgi:hypothetical protein